MKAIFNIILPLLVYHGISLSDFLTETLYAFDTCSLSTIDHPEREHVVHAGQWRSGDYSNRVRGYKERPYCTRIIVGSKQESPFSYFMKNYAYHLKQLSQ